MFVMFTSIELNSLQVSSSLRQRTCWLCFRFWKLKILCKQSWNHTLRHFTHLPHQTKQKPGVKWFPTTHSDWGLGSVFSSLQGEYKCPEACLIHTWRMECCVNLLVLSNGIFSVIYSNNIHNLIKEIHLGCVDKLPEWKTGILSYSVPLNIL